MYFCTRWGLAQQDLLAIREYRPMQQRTVEITKKDLQGHLGEEVTNCIIKAVNTLADLKLPNCILLVLVLVAVFTRDGLFMDKQVSMLQTRDTDSHIFIQEQSGLPEG